MESKQYFGTKEFAYKISGMVMELTSSVEGMINSIIANYFCKEQTKILDFVGFIQQSSFEHRINYLQIIIEEMKITILQDNFDFKYLEKNTNKKADTLIDGIKALKLLRNKFAHSSIQPVQSETNKVFCLQEFKPRSNRLNKNDYPIFDTLEKFSQEDFNNLSKDINLINISLYNAYFKIIPLQRKAALDSSNK